MNEYLADFDLAERLYLFATLGAGLLAVMFAVGACVQLHEGRRGNASWATVAAVSLAATCFLLARHDMPVWLMIYDVVTVPFMLQWIDPEDGLPWNQPEPVTQESR